MQLVASTRIPQCPSAGIRTGLKNPQRFISGGCSHIWWLGRDDSPIRTATRALSRGLVMWRGLPQSMADLGPMHRQKSHSITLPQGQPLPPDLFASTACICNEPFSLLKGRMGCTERHQWFKANYIWQFSLKLFTWFPLVVTLLLINTADSSIVGDMIAREGEGNKKEFLFLKDKQVYSCSQRACSFHLAQEKKKKY